MDVVYTVVSPIGTRRSWISSLSGVANAINHNRAAGRDRPSPYTVRFALATISMATHFSGSLPPRTKYHPLCVLPKGVSRRVNVTVGGNPPPASWAQMRLCSPDGFPQGPVNGWQCHWGRDSVGKDLQGYREIEVFVCHNAPYESQFVYNRTEHAIFHSTCMAHGLLNNL